jgi:nitrite reductase/ring-hydroxylating ferredoxin subunit
MALVWTDDASDADQAPPPGTILCAAADLADGEARVVGYGGGLLPKEILVVRDGDHVRAYLNRCAHLALPLNVGRRVRTANRLLFCDHHHAAFRFEDGLCVEGVCPDASLAAVPITVHEGQVLVADTTTLPRH